MFIPYPLQQRNSLNKKLGKFERRRERAVAENRPEEIVADLEEQMESLRDNVAYVQENINECQMNIVQMEESKVGQGQCQGQCQNMWEKPKAG